MPLLLSGPEYAPLSGAAPKHLVIFLHGVGADGNDLISLAPMFARDLPDAHFVSPDGPFPYDMAPFGRQWFSLSDRSEEAILSGVRQAMPILEQFIQSQLQRFHLAPQNVALVGFSQGSMLALHTSLRQVTPYAGVLAYSGALIAPNLLPAEVRSRPEICLVHGEADEVVPFIAFEEALAALQKAEVPVHGFSRDTLGHGIDQPGLVLGSRFLRSVLMDQAFMVEE